MSNLRVLSIGTNYLGTSSELAGCVNDARDWAKLTKPHAASVTTLIGRKATRRNIEKVAIQWRDKLKPGDVGWVTFSGHGTRERDLTGEERTGYDQAIVCDDFELIYDDEMAGWFAARAKGSFVFAFLDCCHSATMHRGIILPRTIALSRCKRRVVDRVRTPYTLRSLTNACLISGCGDGPTDYSYDGEFSGRPNGAATHYAIQALTELRKPTYRRWFNRLAGKTGYLPNEDYPQTPIIQGSSAMLSKVVPVETS
jgi:metacaspase-1